MNGDYFQEDDLEYWDDEDTAKSCGCADDERCPLCCPNTLYNPGTEECDWCPYSEECEKDFMDWCEQESKRVLASPRDKGVEDA